MFHKKASYHHVCCRNVSISKQKANGWSNDRPADSEHWVHRVRDPQHRVQRTGDLQRQVRAAHSLRLLRILNDLLQLQLHHQLLRLCHLQPPSTHDQKAI